MTTALRQAEVVFADARPPRLLVRGVNWLGDAVMTTPALLRLRERFPESHISLLTAGKLADLWLHHPAVDSVLAIRATEGLTAIARQLRRDPFELGLILPNSMRSALELWWGRVPRRVGYSGGGRRWLLTDPVSRPAGFVGMRRRSVGEIRRVSAPGARGGLPPEPSASAHHIHHYLHLVARLGASPDSLAPVLAVTDGERREVAVRFGLDPEVRWLGINPGAEFGPAKRWPADRFAWIAREVAAWPGWGVVVFGGARDKPLAASIDASVGDAAGGWKVKPHLVNLAGRTTLRELMAALAICDVLVTNDTGPMHVASALGTPVVAVFGSTSPGLTGPGLPGDPRHRLLRSSAACSPCFRRECPIDLRCLRGVSPEEVLAAVLAVAQRSR